MLTGLPGESLYIPAPRWTGGYALFLDFDGCLHPHQVFEKPGSGPFLVGFPGHKLFENAALLEELLLPYPDLRIVLSTSWVRRYRGSLRRTSRWLPPGLRARVVGATFHSRMHSPDFLSASRGMQIWSDVLRRKPKAWLALDDDDRDWPPWCLDHLVRTDEVLGINEPRVLAELRAKLAAMYA
ncbi:HAD domain-containing protein [Paraburkholderia lycopersici]|uniref:HAD domain-containing protein n=1 Tax=Paraburkholderia lycopersici TaxID=416944 RepID=UPI000B875EF6|nr:HAD domain-containing protein [Paraburkholderia lycopersici]